MDKHSPAIPPPLRRKPGPILLFGTTLLVLLNMWLGYAKEVKRTGVPEALGGATANFVLPVIAAVLFSISPRFRSPRSRTLVVLVTSGVIFLGILQSIGRP